MVLKNRSTLGREDLKYNFLKQIVIRFDFSGVTDIELDNMMQDIKLLLRERGYNSLHIELAKETDFELDDPETMEMEGLSVQEIRQQNVYVFSNETPGIILKISPMFAFVTIEKTRYINFFEYSGTLLEVMRIIQDKTTFFSGKRFGLRKVNKCVLTDINTINEYFESAFYHLFSIDDSSTTKLFTARDCIIQNSYNINLTRNVLSGELDRRPVYQVVLDADVYLLNDEEVAQLINNPELLTPMNNLLFNIYKMAITEKFIELLQRDYFDCDEIIGVDKNE